jgi:hypothetical protein
MEPVRSFETSVTSSQLKGSHCSYNNSVHSDGRQKLIIIASSEYIVPFTTFRINGLLEFSVEPCSIENITTLRKLDLFQYSDKRMGDISFVGCTRKS